MSVSERIRHELREIGLVSLFFGLWFLFFLSLKKLILAEYEIDVAVISTAIVGALIVAKTVVIMDKTPVVSWFRSSPVIVQVMWRSISYTGVVFVILLAEQVFDAYRDKGSLSAALSEVWQHRDLRHSVALTLSVGLAFVVFNGSAELDRRLGPGGLRGVLFSPPPAPDGDGDEGDEGDEGDADDTSRG